MEEKEKRRKLTLLQDASQMVFLMNTLIDPCYAGIVEEGPLGLVLREMNASMSLRTSRGINSVLQ